MTNPPGLASKLKLSMRSFLFWGLFPFVLPQAIRLRRNAPEVSAANGPYEGSNGEGPVIRLLAIGDSIIAGVGARKLENALVGQVSVCLARSLESSVHWTATGNIGVASRAVLNQLVPKLPPVKADVILLSVGVNDVTSLSGVSKWCRNLGALLTALRHHSPGAVIAFAGIPPLHVFPLLPQPLRALLGFRGRTLDQAAKNVISKFPRIVHVALDLEPEPEKFSEDGFHPSEESYQVFGEVMAEGVLRAFRNESSISIPGQKMD